MDEEHTRRSGAGTLAPVDLCGSLESAVDKPAADKLLAPLAGLESKLFWRICTGRAP